MRDQPQTSTAPNPRSVPLKEPLLAPGIYVCVNYLLGDMWPHLVLNDLGKKKEKKSGYQNPTLFPQWLDGHQSRPKISNYIYTHE